MYYGNIKKSDIANGIGVRVSLFVSGCTHHCKGCFNEETWDFKYGEIFTKKTQEQIFKWLEPSYVSGLTVLGGEPMEYVNQQELLPFLKEVKRRFPDKTIWCYTGFTYEEILSDSRLSQILPFIDVLVDGPFIQEKRDTELLFRGSSNQRIIYLNGKEEDIIPGTVATIPLK